MRRLATIKDSTGKAVGNRTKAKVVKNKVAPPFVESEFDILYAEGISRTGAVIDAAIEHGLVDKRGTWLSFEGQQLGQGRDAARDNLKNDPELEKKLRDKIMEKIHQAGGPVAAAKAKAAAAPEKEKDEDEE